jgi:hypothetical protein
MFQLEETYKKEYISAGLAPEYHGYRIAFYLSLNKISDTKKMC